LPSPPLSRARAHVLALPYLSLTPRCRHTHTHTGSRLLYGGAQCLDATTLEAANVKAGDTLHMVLALRGGAL
jgi:hypothetical protein